jgi:hypothetical protein
VNAADVFPPIVIVNEYCDPGVNPDTVIGLVSVVTDVDAIAEPDPEVTVAA